MESGEGGMTRKEKWRAFFVEIERLQYREAAPAFVQEITRDLWSVQKLIRRSPPAYGLMYQLFRDPPPACNFEAYYNGWPGDRRGWMRFESKESARDFFKFAEGMMSYSEYCSLPRAPLSLVRIELDDDDRGSFVEHA